MAIATALKKTVNDGVTLTLSQAEAEAVRLVLGYVGGPQDNTPRKHTEAVLRTLKNIGITNPDGNYKLDGVLRFMDTSAPKCAYTLTSINPFTARSY